MDRKRLGEVLKRRRRLALREFSQIWKDEDGGARKNTERCLGEVIIHFVDEAGETKKGQGAALLAAKNAFGTACGLAVITGSDHLAETVARETTRLLTYLVERKVSTRLPDPTRLVQRHVRLVA